MMFDNHSTAQISIMAINFASGFVAVLAYFVMSGIPLTKDAASKIVHFFRFFPPYLLGEGLIAVSSTTFSNSVFGTKVIEVHIQSSCSSHISNPVLAPYRPKPPSLDHHLPRRYRIFVGQCVDVTSCSCSSSPSGKQAPSPHPRPKTTSASFNFYYLLYYPLLPSLSDRFPQYYPPSYPPPLPSPPHFHPHHSSIRYFLCVLLTEASFARDWGNYLQKRRALLALQYMKQRGKLGGNQGLRPGGVLRGVVVNAESQEGIDQVPVDEDAEGEEGEEEGGVDVDDDVAAEQAKVESLGADRKGEYALCIDGLVKVYPPSFLGGQPKHAVRGMSLACPPGETFGFLGINGAGKSSTLNVLTGDIAPTGVYAAIFQE